MGDTILLVHVRGAFLLFGTTTMASCQLWPDNSLFILLRVGTSVVLMQEFAASTQKLLSKVGQGGGSPGE